MTNEDKIFEQLRQRMVDYKEQPDEALRQNIEKKLQDGKMPVLKILTVAGALVLISGIVALIAAPKTVKTEQQSVENTEKTVVLTDDNTDTAIQKAEPITKNTLPTTVSNQITERPQREDNFAQEKTEPAVVKDNPKTENNSLKQEQPVKINQNVTVKEQTNNQENTNAVNEFLVEENGNDTDAVAEEKLFIPNAFEPLSNDDRLRIFKPAYREVKNYEMQIFSRNGKKIFSSKDIALGWDGKINGRLADKGTYIYYIKYEDINGKVHNQNGTLWLNR